MKKTAREPARAPKGMRDIAGSAYYAYQGFMEKAAEIAIYYGFTPIETPILEHASTFTTGVGETTDIVEKEMYTLKTRGGDQLALRPEGTAGVMRAYIEGGMQSLPQPVMLYYQGPFFRHDRPQAGRFREFKSFGIEIIGTDRSIADAMVIRIMHIALREAGITDLVLEVNSIGDKNCRHFYRKAIVSYYRKHASAICGDCKRRLKTNPLRLLDCKEPKCASIKNGAPEPVSTLCDLCKKHFKEILESLEAVDIEYKINPTLVRGLDYYTRTVFEFTIPKPSSGAGNGTDSAGAPERYAVAGGGRYDYLARLLGSKRDVPAVGAQIGVDRIMLSPEHAYLPPRIVKKPKVFLVQLGFDAKLKSMVVIEILRKARIPIVQALPKDSLASQLASAERANIPYAFIIGQKEVIDETIIVRNMETRSQDIVRVRDLSEYIKNRLK